ncbi:MAG: hypothetical protein AAGA19_17415, partial [Pseudomonadota bacterium]
MIKISFAWVAILVMFSACTPRNELGFGAPAPSATTRDVWVAKFRSDMPTTSRAAPPRPEAGS